ncbi:MAG: ATP-dependent helicase [Alphaproteobacteria bacterium]|nr:ATP-dependent helicase [Alphaproteobacteria bacterium]
MNDEFFNDIQIRYQDYRQIEEGIVSHDDILVLANHMFKKYPMLRRIVKNKFHYILVDEYQDTFFSVIEILLDFLRRDNTHSNIIGFFGDSMQSIYNGRVGDLEKYCAENVVQNVVKDDNYRCSKAVIDLLNNIRNDIKQEPSGKNKRGSAKFLYTSGNAISMFQLKQNQHFANWHFDDPKDTKELYLTHKLIAMENGFEEIYGVYRKNNERLLKEDNQDRLIKHLFRIQEIVYLYQTSQFNEFMKKTDFKLKRLSDKQDLSVRIQKVLEASQGTIDDVMHAVAEDGLINADDRLADFTNDNQKLYDEVLAMPYKQIECVFNYVKDFTPFSTQHNVKGAEFENVLVVLDNGRWNDYNFKYLFENTAGKESIINRTKKIFYVCCSRTKDNLVVYFDNPSAIALQEARNLFGNDNVIKLE